MKTIQLTQGQATKVSDHRYEDLIKWSWFAKKKKNGFYAVRAGSKKQIFLHRQIMGVTEPKIFIDHIDGDGLNNQDENLRTCNNAQNMANRGKTIKNTSGYKGVYRNNKGWIAEIKKDGVHVFRKTFTNIIDAAHAYDEAAKEHFGEFAD